jgi:ComF family protein
LKHEPHVCRKLIEELVKTQQRAPLNVATQIIPVPLHADRERERGFNQATLIAREFSRATSLPLNAASLIRVKNIRQHRAGMDAKGRRDTVADVFRVVQPALVAGERVLLIDDVFTTGATASACANVLLKAGAAEVLVLTIARPARL